MKKEIPKHMHDVRKKRIFKRVLLVVLSIVVFVYAFFFMPLPNNMKRAFGPEECKAKGGQWHEGNAHCKQVLKDK